MNFDLSYYFVISVSVLVIPLVVQWVGFSIIHWFYILVPGWVFWTFVWLSLLVILTHLFIQHSHGFTIETSELCVGLGIIWSSYSSSGKAGKYNIHGLLDCMICPFGNPTRMVGSLFVDGKCGASTCKLCTVSPVTDIPVIFLFYGVW